MFKRDVAGVGHPLQKGDHVFDHLACLTDFLDLLLAQFFLSIQSIHLYLLSVNVVCFIPCFFRFFLQFFLFPRSAGAYHAQTGHAQSNAQTEGSHEDWHLELITNLVAPATIGQTII